MDEPRIYEPTTHTPANEVLPLPNANFGSTVGPFGRHNPDPGPAFRQAFTDAVKAGIVAAARRAYDIVQSNHDEALGYNANTFGHNVYHLGKHHLKAFCARSGNAISTVDEMKTLFRCQSGEYTVGLYKVGHSETANIWESFPTAENGAVTISSEGYPVLLGLEDALLDTVNATRYVIVAHLGNPTDGLCAVYLCIPILTDGNKIKRWGYAEAIYLRGDQTSGVTPPPIPPPPETKFVDLVPEEVVADVVVTMKP